MAKQDFSTATPSNPPAHRITNYSTNLADQEWLTIRSLLPRVMLNSKNRKVDLRNVLDAISYWCINDIPLNQLPEDLPRPGTVHYFCYRFAHDGTFDKIFKALGNKNQLVLGLQKKMKSLRWIGQTDNVDTTKEHNQYVDKQE